MSAWPAGRHLAEVYDALYAALGEGAVLARLDAAVVRLHDASRAFGALALELRTDEDLGADPLLTAVLGESLVEDPTGALTLYALAMVIGPRLLVSLSDYLDVEDDEDRRRVLHHGADVVVAEVRAAGATLARHGAPQDPAWADAARALLDRFEGAAMAESLGRRH